MTNKQKNRFRKLSDLASIIQDNKDFYHLLVPPDEPKQDVKTQPIPTPINTTEQDKASQEFDVPGAVNYNIKSEETFKQHEDEVKRILNTTADWKSPEFANAVYKWQKNNGLVGKWIDGKFGPVTMSAMAKLNDSLKEQYSSEAVTPWQADGKVKLRLTGYWPYTARPDERKMEGGIFDRKMPQGYSDKPYSKQYQAHVLHTAEQHLADPIKHPFVSLSGDDSIWPYGQEIMIPWTNGRTLRGKVVDTGSHFRGKNKVYRTEGYEPIDVCVNSAQTKVPTHVVAQVVGDFPKSVEPMIAQSKIIQRIKDAKRGARKIILDDIK